MITIRTHSEEETVAFGRGIAAELSGVVLLSGDLGAGKTTLVHGIVAGIEGADASAVSSPTFTLIHEYGAGVYHLDLYRLDGERDLATLELDDIFDRARLALIEWGERLGNRTPARRTEIRIRDAGENDRFIEIERMGN